MRNSDLTPVSFKSSFFVFVKLSLKLSDAGSDHLQVNGEGRDNPFRRRSSSRLLDPLVLALVQQVPGVGKVKALALLQHFSSIKQLCDAASCDLEPIVGQAAAQKIHSFFHKPTAGT